MPRNAVEMLEDVTREIEEFRASYDRRLQDLETKAGRPPAPGGDREAMSEHAKAYQRFLRKGITDGLAGVSINARMSVGSDPDGGYAVPEDLDRTIGKLERDATPMRQVATVMQVENETYEKLMSLGGAGAGWVGEIDARPETGTPQLASVKPFFGEVYANPFATQKILDDAMYDVAAWLAEEVADAFSEYENTAFILGDGVKKAKGLLTYPIVAAPAFGQLKQIKSGVAGGTTIDKLLEVLLSLKPKYVANASWMMGSATALLIRQLKDLNGRPYWPIGEEKLLGKPVVYNEALPQPAAGSHSIAFGDFKRGYKIADVVGTRILRDPYTVKGMVGFYATKRLGGGVEDSSAITIHTLGV